jgi:serine/threonine protein kinase/cytochrome c-type biogenesis protein CcmH/NrfG
MIGTTVSHYKIIEKLGEGGMGVVYKAIDSKLDRPVAIKFLPVHLSTSAENKARFIQEARATAALNHPNILNVYDIDEQDDGLFFVMEYIEGETLKSRITGLKSAEGIPLRQAIDLTIQVAQGLKAAHEKEIVHRDIKPENIMLTKEGNPKIMDFGIAKLKSGTGLTKTGMSLGTLSYMSPEQSQGLAADHRSDLWSLGVVLYEMLTGELPFKAEHEAALIYLIMNEELLAPSSHDRRILPSVDSLVLKMLEKDRDRRFQSTNEVIAALQIVQADIQQAGQASKTKAIALLPFENISPDKESDYFSDGLTEELILSLSKLKNMRVVSRTSTMQYKGTKKDIKTIGRELGARYILEGSVRKFQDDLRITVQLVDVDNDAQLWAAKYKGKLQDIFDIQEQVAEQIVDALMVKLSPSEKVVLTKRSTENAEALDYYLRARKALYRMSQKDINNSIQLFQKAIELDRRYAMAYAGMGEAYAQLYQNFERNESYLDKAVEASHKALMYDATLSEAYAALGIAYVNKKMLDEALEAGRKAIELDPNNHIAYWILGRIYHTSDQDTLAIEVYKKCIELNPDFYSAHGDLYYAYEKVGEKNKQKEAFQNVLRIVPRYLENHPDDGRAHMILAIFLAQAGKIDEAKSEAAKAISLNPTDPLMHYNSACFYAQIGEKGLSLESLQNAITSGYQNYEWMKRDPDLDSIRDEPQYIELMKGK